MDQRRCRLDDRRGQERHARVQDGNHDDQHDAGPDKEDEDYWQSESADGEWEDEVVQEVVLEEGFDPASVPPDVSAALDLAKPDEALAVDARNRRRMA